MWLAVNIQVFTASRTELCFFLNEQVYSKLQQVWESSNAGFTTRYVFPFIKVWVSYLLDLILSYVCSLHMSVDDVLSNVMSFIRMYFLSASRIGSHLINILPHFTFYRCIYCCRSLITLSLSFVDISLRLYSSYQLPFTPLYTQFQQFTHFYYKVFF